MSFRQSSSTIWGILWGDGESYMDQNQQLRLDNASCTSKQCRCASTTSTSSRPCVPCPVRKIHYLHLVSLRRCVKIDRTWMRSSSAFRRVNSEWLYRQADTEKLFSKPAATETWALACLNWHCCVAQKVTMRSLSEKSANTLEENSCPLTMQSTGSPVFCTHVVSQPRLLRQLHQQLSSLASSQALQSQ